MLSCSDIAHVALGRVLVGLVSGWTWCWGSHLGVPCGLDLKSQSLVIESFSVGSRAVLSTMGEGFGGSRFKVLYGPSF